MLVYERAGWVAAAGAIAAVTLVGGALDLRARWEMTVATLAPSEPAPVAGLVDPPALEIVRVEGCASDGVAPLARYRIAIAVWPDGHDGWLDDVIVTGDDGCYAADFDFKRPVHAGRVDVEMRAPIDTRIVVPIHQGLAVHANLVLGTHREVAPDIHAFGPP